MTDAVGQQPTAPTLPQWRGQRLLTRDGDQVAVELTPRAEALNYRGEVHGGAIATLVDVTMAIAAFDGLPDQVIPVTAGLTVNYLRPGAGRLVAEAEVVARSERRRITHVLVTDGDRNHVASGHGTFAIVHTSDKKPPPMPV